MSAAFRFPIRVKPNARREIVGGVWPGPNGDALVIAVAAPAVDGKANDAVRKAVAAAFGVRRQQVSIIAGDRSRDKLIELDPAPDGAAEQLAALLAR